MWIATPDHQHFPDRVRALEAGLAVYCEKPLCHDIFEARRLREMAAARRVPTQMGNQGHSSEYIRLLCEWIWQGSLGDVTEVHVRPPHNEMDSGSRDRRPSRARAGQPRLGRVAGAGARRASTARASTRKAGAAGSTTAPG